MGDELFDNSPSLDAINADIGEEVPEAPDQQTEKEVHAANIQVAQEFSALTPTEKATHAGLIRDQLKDRIIELHCDKCKQAEENLQVANTDLDRLRKIEIDYARLREVSKRRRLTQATNAVLMTLGACMIGVYSQQEGTVMFGLASAAQAYGSGWALVIFSGGHQILRAVFGA